MRAGDIADTVLLLLTLEAVERSREQYSFSGAALLRRAWWSRVACVGCDVQEGNHKERRFDGTLALVASR